MFVVKMSCRVGVVLTWVALCVLAAQGAETARWTPISDGAVAQLAKEGKKPGEYGPTAGVAVDRTTGDVYMLVNGQGLWKSTDRGGHFTRVDGGKITGRCETGFAIDADPQGKRLACFPVYGSAAITTDAGKTWLPSSTGHVDCIAVGWPETCMAAIRHESGGTLILTADGGKTWKTLGKGFLGVGVFDARTLVACKDAGILRSTDGGATWTTVSALKPSGKAVRSFGRTAYWVSDKGLLVSRDRGASWALSGEAVSCTLGPYFGGDENQLLVGGKQGLFVSADGGKSWKRAAPLPPGLDGGIMCSFAWDPLHGVFYASRMGNPTYRRQP